MDRKEYVSNSIKTKNDDLDILKKHFSHCFDKDGNFDFEKFKQELSQSEVNFSKESYGLEWLGKSYARLLATDEATTLLKEDEEWNKKEENKTSQNLLIKGDNLEVLKHLSHAYYEKVKMIYIDPPYNTGSDGFVYSDNRKFTPQKLSELAGVSEEKAKRILEFTQSKSNSHSAWLTFIYPRLYIAKRLLKEDGVIFVSIDDNEVAQLRLLMDEIFGEENFVSQLVWRKKAGGGNDSADIAIEHEYVLVYFKEKVVDFRLPLREKTIKSYKYKDEKFEELGPYKLKDLNDPSLSDSKGLHYDIHCPDGKILKGNENQWKCNYQTFQERLKNNRIIFQKDKNDKWKVYYKIYLNEEKGQVKRDKQGNIIQKKRNPESILYDIALNKDGNKDIKHLFEDNVIFKYPKPVKLLTHLLNMLNDDECIILDFFAGSGTTGDAVMQLNAEDGGNRRYILVQLPEEIDPKKNKTAYEFVKNELGVENPTIFEITKERLIRAAKKIKEDNKDKDLKTQDFGFKIFETVPIWEDYEFEASEFDPQLSLFDESKLSEEDLKTLLTTWKTYDGVELTKEFKEVDLDGYTGYEVENILYLVNKNFNSDNLKALVEKIDSDKEFNPTKIVAFGYNFESSSLKEMADNLKSYINRKNSDISFIVRY